MQNPANLMLEMIGLSDERDRDLSDAGASNHNRTIAKDAADNPLVVSDAFDLAVGNIVSATRRALRELKSGRLDQPQSC